MLRTLQGERLQPKRLPDGSESKRTALKGVLGELVHGLEALRSHAQFLGGAAGDRSAPDCVEQNPQLLGAPESGVETGKLCGRLHGGALDLSHRGGLQRVPRLLKEAERLGKPPLVIAMNAQCDTKPLRPWV